MKQNANLNLACDNKATVYTLYALVSYSENNKTQNDLVWFQRVRIEEMQKSDDFTLER